MIAIAGVVGVANPNRSKMQCQSSLGGLRPFGSDPFIACVGLASFGALRPQSGACLDYMPCRLGDLLCVVDGRIDNLSELRRQLELPASSAPAEVLAHAWRQWGQATTLRLIGEYAFALFDNSKRRLWLARDPSGYRPLFYHDQGRGVSFATMPSGLIAIHGGGPDLERFARHVDGLHCEGAESFWTRTRQVPAGVLACFGEGGRSQRTILPPPAHRSSGEQWEDLVGEMRHRLDRAVERNLVGAGPTVAAQLSSGLDSSAIAATAARKLEKGQVLMTLTAAPPQDARLLVPRGRFADESALAANTARAANAEHVVIREKSRLLTAIRGIAGFFQQPAPAQFSFPWWRAMGDQVRERGGSVMLTGGQGNATLSYGGLGALARYLGDGRLVDWWREARGVVASEDVRWRGVLFNSFRSFVPGPLADRLLQAANGISQLPPSFVRREWRQYSSSRATASSGYMADRLELIRNFDAGTRKRGMFALTGVEERDPAADRELMEFSLSLPPEAHLKDGRIKPLIRDSLADRVPASVLSNRQRGVSGADWYDRIGPADCRDAMEDIRASAHAFELLDLEALDRAIDHWPDFDPSRQAWLGNFGRRIAKALSTGLFLAETDRYPLGDRPDRI